MPLLAYVTFTLNKICSKVLREFLRKRDIISSKEISVRMFRKLQQIVPWKGYFLQNKILF